MHEAAFGNAPITNVVNGRSILDSLRNAGAVGALNIAARNAKRTRGFTIVTGARLLVRDKWKVLCGGGTCVTCAASSCVWWVAWCAAVVRSDKP